MLFIEHSGNQQVMYQSQINMSL